MLTGFWSTKPDHAQRMLPHYENQSIFGAVRCEKHVLLKVNEYRLHNERCKLTVARIIFIRLANFNKSKIIFSSKRQTLFTEPLKLLRWWKLTHHFQRKIFSKQHILAIFRKTMNGLAKRTSQLSYFHCFKTKL